MVAEDAGKVVGSNFLDERGPIAGVEPITVDPTSQNGTIGRQLMSAVLGRARERYAAGVRRCNRLGQQLLQPLAVLNEQ